MLDDESTPMNQLMPADDMCLTAACTAASGDRAGELLRRIWERLPPLEQRILTRIQSSDEPCQQQLLDISAQYMKEVITWDRCLYSILHVVNTKSLEYNHLIYTELFRHIDTDAAKSLASKSVAAMGLSVTTHTELVYGEIDFHSFASILERVNPKRGSVFVDLGHGTGKALICTWLLYSDRFSRIHGVEILEDLYLASVEVVESAKKIMSERDDELRSCCDVTVCQGDLLSEDQSTACVKGIFFDWGQAGNVFSAGFRVR
jgi:hypothetical protein